MIFETEISRARSPSCSLKLDSVQMHSIPRVWMISFSCQTVRTDRTLNFEIACTSGGFVFSRKFSGYHLFSVSFVTPHSTENKRNPFCRVGNFRKQFQKGLQLSKCRFASPNWNFQFQFFSPETKLSKILVPYSTLKSFLNSLSAFLSFGSAFFENFGFELGYPMIIVS